MFFLSDAINPLCLEANPEALHSRPYNIFPHDILFWIFSGAG